MTADDPHKILERYGTLDAKDVPLAGTALTLSSMRHKGLTLDRYYNHIRKMGAAMTEAQEQLLKSGAEDNAETQIAAIKAVFIYDEGYTGIADQDEPFYDSPEHSDLTTVIDQRCGAPIALSLVCLEAARAAGFEVVALRVPGHLVLRLEADGQRVMFDPYQDCKLLQAPDLRRLVKEAQGPQAELSADYYEALTNRAILVRLQNRIKTIQIAAEDYNAALETALLTRLFAPEEYRLALDIGVLAARLGRHEEAIVALEHYIGRAPMDRDRRDAAMLLQQIKSEYRF